MARPISELIARFLDGAFERIALAEPVRRLLDAHATDATVPSGVASTIDGTATASVSDVLGGFAEVAFDPGGPAIPFRLERLGPAGAPSGFRLDLRPGPGRLRLPAGCRGARVVGGPDARHLVEDAGASRVELSTTGARPVVLRIEASVDRAAWTGVVVGDASGEESVIVTVAPPAFLLGGQGFGLELPSGIGLSGVGLAAGSGAPTPAADERRVSVRGARLFLPPQTPWIGAGPIDVEFEWSSARGLYGRSTKDLPATGSRPAFAVTVVWDDPVAASLDVALPTSVEIVATWGADELRRFEVAGSGVATLGGGRPIRLTGRYARRPGTSDLVFGVVLASEGAEGVLSVPVTGDGDVAGRVVLGAAALATALIADAAPSGDAALGGSGATFAALFAAASAVGSFLEGDRVTVHSIALDGGTAGADAGVVMRIDYSADVRIETIDVGVLRIGATEGVPMRLRTRDVKLVVDLREEGLERFRVSFADAKVTVEDPGRFTIETAGPMKDLFDVVGSRAGHGSVWFELELRFALDLGPVKVNGATIRVTLTRGGAIRPELRGLDASLSIPGLLEARGAASVGADGLDLSLRADLVPLNVAAIVRMTSRGRMLLFSLGVDLPGPIPLANSGLGLFGLGGIFGEHAKFVTPPGPDPIEAQLTADPMSASGYVAAEGRRVVGLGAVIGTAPDLGYAFSARAVAVVALPDLAIRAAVHGRVLSPCVSIGPPRPGDPGESRLGPRFDGVLTVSDEGVTIAMRASYEIPVLFRLEAPFGASFPSRNPSSWFTHLGADGVNGRGPGPVRAQFLPDFLDVGASAFLMVRGDGIPNVGGDPLLSPTGFSIGAGARFNVKYGIPPVYAEVAASAALALGSRPLIVAGTGRLSGSLHLGPVSVGVHADLHLLYAPELGERWMELALCGEVDLLFFSLSECVRIEVGQRATSVPPPSDWPLVSVALADHLYTRIEEAHLSPDRPDGPAVPTVWPDVIPILQFSTGPANGFTDAARSGPFVDRLAWDPVDVGDGRVGNDRLNATYHLRSVRLLRIDPTLGEVPVPGPLDAAWQEAKRGAPGEPGARELALLTWETTLWTRKLLDGGERLVPDVISRVGERCRRDPRPVPGWALGERAVRSESGVIWSFPTEPASDPLVSMFRVDVSATWRRVPILESTLPCLPQFPMRLFGPTSSEVELFAEDRGFHGALEAPCVTGLPVDASLATLGKFGEFDLVVELRFSEALIEALVALRVADWPDGYAASRVTIEFVKEDGAHVSERMSGARGIEGGFVRTGRIDGGRFVGARISFPIHLAVGLLGVRGTTRRADDDAESARNATKKAARDAERRASRITPRPLLEPNSLYCIAVETVGQSQRDGVPGPIVPAHVDRWWFRTAGSGRASTRAGTEYPQGVSSEAAIRHYEAFIASPTLSSANDTFDPVYLRRYLLGWTPSERAEPWFVKDPVGVHFAVNHVPALAAKYGFDTALRVRRVDPPPRPAGTSPPSPVDLVTLWPGAVSSAQPAADLRLHELTKAPGGCPHPSPGVFLGGDARLESSARYELALRFPRRGLLGEAPPGHVDRPAGELRGPLFSTSRYADPDELLADLGFARGGTSGRGLSGDLEVRDAAVRDDDPSPDATLDRALDVLGLGRREPTDRGRSSGLWVRVGDAWLLRGVLLESPEPIERRATHGLYGFDGRLRLDRLDSGGTRLGRVLGSSAGDRVLFLAGAPFVPTAALSLTVWLQELPLRTTKPAERFTFTCAVARSPDFLGDVA